ncbi:MAG: hypothetical protein QOJ80_2128 [Mycobacterium sp.]|jgi:uncharacterized protein YkwD|nr:hypothetical protein [Mycobacterium sp.]
MKITSRLTRREARKTVGVGAVVLALTGALVGAPATASADPDPTLLKLINQQRAQANPRCKALNSNPQLQAAADRHAKDLATNGWRNDHNDSDGTLAEQRIDQAGYDWGSFGENQAQGTSAQGAVNGWMNSGSHKANMLDCTMTDAGTASSGSVYVAVFAHPL